MNPKGKYIGTLRYLYDHWPLYLLLYGGVAFLLIGMGVAANQGWLSFVPLALAIVLVLLYFLLASLWAAHRLYDSQSRQPHHVLFELGQLREYDRFAYIDLNGRFQIIELGRRLTTGQIAVLDIYNPQLTPSTTLARSRARSLALPVQSVGDPRFLWRNGSINLLPLPDECVTAVILNETLSQFWQKGDQEILLREVRRILIPGGRLLVAERTRTSSNWLHLGPGAFRLQNAHTWRDLLRQAGFILRREEDLYGLMLCLRADKPIPVEAQQLQLGLNL